MSLLREQGAQRKWPGVNLLFSERAIFCSVMKLLWRNQNFRGIRFLLEHNAVDVLACGYGYS